MLMSIVYAKVRLALVIYSCYRIYLKKNHIYRVYVNVCFVYSAGVECSRHWPLLFASQGRRWWARTSSSPFEFYHMQPVNLSFFVQLTLNTLQCIGPDSSSLDIWLAQTGKKLMPPWNLRLAGRWIIGFRHQTQLFSRLFCRKVSVHRWAAGGGWRRLDQPRDPLFFN